MMMGEGQEEEFRAEERVLCPDEACIGLIGPDGRCKVCGRAAEGAEESTHAQAHEDVHEEAAAEESEDFAARRLCPDDACIGVIGADGRCKVCGRPGEGE